MFDKSFEVCTAIAENLTGAHHMWHYTTKHSYIYSEGGGMVFISNQEAYRVFGNASVKWNEEDFIDLDKTGKRLSGEILKQMEEYEKEGKANLSFEEWFTEVSAFELKQREWNKQIWVDDIEKLEVKRWANFLETQENPIFQDLAEFLNCHIDNDKQAENLPDRPHFRELLESEIAAAKKLEDFLASHSNDLLREGADWIPQWVGAH